MLWRNRLPRCDRSLGIEPKIKLALFFQHGRKPRIVAPVRLHDDRLFKLLLAKEFIDRILFAARIPVGPNL